MEGEERGATGAAGGVEGRDVGHGARADVGCVEGRGAGGGREVGDVGVVAVAAGENGEGDAGRGGGDAAVGDQGDVWVVDVLVLEEVRQVGVLLVSVDGGRACWAVGRDAALAGRWRADEVVVLALDAVVVG